MCVCVFDIKHGFPIWCCSFCCFRYINGSYIPLEHRIPSPRDAGLLTDNFDVFHQSLRQAQRIWNLVLGSDEWHAVMPLIHGLCIQGRQGWYTSIATNPSKMWNQCIELAYMNMKYKKYKTTRVLPTHEFPLSLKGCHGFRTDWSLLKISAL